MLGSFVYRTNRHNILCYNKHEIHLLYSIVLPQYAFPAEKTGKIERVCVVREKQKSGYGRVLIEAAEKWLKEYDVDHIVITSQDRAAGFYEKLGYKLNPDADLSVYDHHAPKKDEEPKKPKKNLGFTCVLVEKYV